MASSSKPRRTPSTKPTTAGQARTIAARRSGTLPRQVHAATPDAPAPGRKAAKPKPAAVKDVTAVAVKKPRAPRAKKRPAGVAEASPSVAPELPVPADTELTVEASAIVEETAIDQAPFALTAEVNGSANTEVDQATATTVAAAPSAAPRKRGVIRTAWRLLSTLSWWTRLRH